MICKMRALAGIAHRAGPLVSACEGTRAKVLIGVVAFRKSSPDCRLHS